MSRGTVGLLSDSYPRSCHERSCLYTDFQSSKKVWMEQDVLKTCWQFVQVVRGKTQRGSFDWPVNPSDHSTWIPAVNEVWLSCSVVSTQELMRASERTQCVCDYIRERLGRQVASVPGSRMRWNPRWCALVVPFLFDLGSKEILCWRIQQSSIKLSNNQYSPSSIITNNPNVSQQAFRWKLNHCWWMFMCSGRM